MPRPKSDDPKVAVTIRVRRSVLARLGGDVAAARAVIEGLCEGRGGVVAEVKAVPKRVAPVFHVEAPMLVRKAFNPQPKPGKR